MSGQTELYIATNGNDANDGSINNPLATLIGARDKARSTGIKTIYIRGGRYNFDNTCTLDSQDSGIIFSGYQDEKVIFDGSKFIDVAKFQPVTNANLLAKLHSKAQGKVYSQIITNNDLKVILDKSTAQLSVNDKMATVARFPNLGFAHINVGTATGEVVNTDGTESDPKGASFKLRERIDGSKWSAEINRIKKMQIKGYISADWLKETKPVNSVETDGTIRLRDGSAYGIKDGAAHVSRLFFYHLLCELDEPGEWYFDSTDSRLYLWPLEALTDRSTVGVWAGPQCFEINDAQDIQIKKMTIQNLGSGRNGEGAINVIGASRNILVAGVTFRFIAEPLTSLNFWADVKDSRVLSCDFYDVPNNCRLYGGKITSTSVEYGNNVMENCHFTQIYSKDFYGKACGIRGAGNVFRNNLIHNMNGQPLSHTGVDHLIELNEAFNVGVEEGDGGSFYTGAKLWSFGNKVRHNFIHHNMTVPGLLGKGGIHIDDVDAGDEIYENVFYKGGWASVKMNKAGGHSISRNVMLEAFMGIRNNSNSLTATYDTAIDYLTTDPTNTIKANYIGRMLKEVGVSGWQTGLTADNWPDRVENFWYSRYPKMRALFDGINDNDMIGPFATDYTDNMFYGTILRPYTVSSLNIETITGTQDITLDVFANPETLNFKFKEPRPGFAPDIPFEKIGLYLDQYRCAVPDKRVYREKVKQRFDGRACHSSSAAYDFNNVNSILYYNSGEEVYKLVPCLGAVEELGDDSYVVKAIGETCPDKDNGQIKIEAKEDGSYMARLNGGADINFNKEWVIENLAPGPYELCVTNTTTNQTQCFTFDIEAGSSVTGKTSLSKGQVNIEITEGTGPFDVSVNGEQVLQTRSQAFSVKANYGDIVEVTTSVACEGSIAKTMGGIVSASPNPTSGAFEITLSMPLHVVVVEVYNVYSQRISSKSYQVNGGKVQLDINEVPAGIYFAAIQLGKNKPEVLKIIKK